MKHHVTRTDCHPYVYVGKLPKDGQAVSVRLKDGKTKQVRYHAGSRIFIDRYGTRYHNVVTWETVEGHGTKENEQRRKEDSE